MPKRIEEALEALRSLEGRRAESILVKLLSSLDMPDSVAVLAP